MSGTRRNFNFSSPLPRPTRRGCFRLLDLPRPTPRQPSRVAGVAAGGKARGEVFKTQSRGAGTLKRQPAEGGGSARMPATLSWERDAGPEADIRARHREARYNAPRAHFISYCRELPRHGNAGLDVRTCRASAGEE